MSEQRTCQNCKSSFTIDPEDFAFYERIEVPPPTFRVECQEERRIAYRNERALYKNILARIATLNKLSSLH